MRQWYSVNKVVLIIHVCISLSLFEIVILVHGYAQDNVIANPFIHLVVRLTTGPKPLPKRALHIVRFRASSFKWEYDPLSLRSSSSFLRLLPRLLVTSTPPFIFPSITCCIRQFLRKMWPIQLAFRLLISCRIFLSSLTLSNTSSFLTWSGQYYTFCLSSSFNVIFSFYLVLQDVWKKHH